MCDDGVNDHLAGGCLPGCQSQDLSDAVVACELLEVDIQIDPADDEALRFETKRRHTIFGTCDCRNEQIVNPYNWYPVTVTVDGVPIENAGFRKKGTVYEPAPWGRKFLGRRASG